MNMCAFTYVFMHVNIDAGVFMPAGKCLCLTKDIGVTVCWP